MTLKNFSGTNTKNLFFYQGIRGLIFLKKPPLLSRIKVTRSAIMSKLPFIIRIGLWTNFTLSALKKRLFQMNRRGFPSASSRLFKGRLAFEHHRLARTRTGTVSRRSSGGITPPFGQLGRCPNLPNNSLELPLHLPWPRHCPCGRGGRVALPRSG